MPMPPTRASSGFCGTLGAFAPVGGTSASPSSQKRLYGAVSPAQMALARSGQVRSCYGTGLSRDLKATYGQARFHRRVSSHRICDSSHLQPPHFSEKIGSPALRDPKGGAGGRGGGATRPAMRNLGPGRCAARREARGRSWAPRAFLRPRPRPGALFPRC